MENKVITLRTAYKVKEYHMQPCPDKNGMNKPFVKKVRYDSNGTSEMILSEAERNDPNSQYFIPEDADIKIVDGTTFNLANPLEKNMWEAIKDSDLIVPSRDARDKNGNPLIDGDKKRYGIAEIWVDVPGEESEKSVAKKKLITKAWTYIENDSVDGRLTKCKLLGKAMSNAPSADVEDYLYQKASSSPNLIIDLYTSSDSAIRLLIIDAKERGIIIKKSGLFMYGETVLGATDDAMIIFFKNVTNKAILDLIKNETYPEFAQKFVPEEAESVSDEPKASKASKPAAKK